MGLTELLKDSKALKAVCLSAGIATAWGPESAQAHTLEDTDPNNITGLIDTPKQLTNVYLLYGVNSSGGSVQQHRTAILGRHFQQSGR